MAAFRRVKGNFCLKSGVRGAAIIQDLLTLARRGVAVVEHQGVIGSSGEDDDESGVQEFHPNQKAIIKDLNRLPFVGSGSIAG